MTSSDSRQGECARIAAVGAGAFGTALALCAVQAGHRAILWSRRAEHADMLLRARENTDYLPGVALPEALEITSELADVVEADILLLAVPAQHQRALAARLAALGTGRKPIVICAKGIEEKTGALLSDVVASELPDMPVFVLSGPTFASELARGLPTAATIAGPEADARRLAGLLGHGTFRLYYTHDLIGVQVGGAMKNVIAIAAGIVEGRRLGSNARAGLITRGLAEIGRLTTALGGRTNTLMGLAGLGDLTLTCNGRQSRNFSLGIEIGQGRSLPEILAQRRTVTEGVSTVSALVALSEKLDVELPISAAVDAVLHERVDLDEMVHALLTRPVTAEWRD